MFGTHLLLQIFLLVLHVSAEPQNITIDDTSPRFDYRGIQLIERCNTLASGGSITLNFTGTAIYVFFALNSPFLDETFSIDGVVADRKGTTPGAAEWTRAYNITIIRATSLNSGPHFFNMSANSVGSLFFDYAIITQSTSAISFTSTGSIMPSTSTPADSAVHPSTQAKLSTGAIAGIGVGTAFISVMIAVGIYLCLRARKRIARVGGGHSSQPPPDATETIPSPTAIELVAEMRMMRSQVERLAADQRRSSAASTFSGLESPTASRDLSTISRSSVSIMKREQSRVLRAINATATNSIVHTDSGLRLTAGTSPDEIPPQYAPE
ncbi:hypothetical protein B0H13DRAFT_2319968 [Mycena leptocephala]|nr:hypothetical protein B0H13DRAFT_2319968 [Mycena leptocephala]